MLDIINQLLLKNRTIVTKDDAVCMDILKKKYPFKVHKYATNSDCQTWIIPPEWNVNHATLKLNGKLIASYEDSMLFLAPYSTNFTGIVNKKELVEHTFTNPKVPEAFCYEHRLAYDFKRRLKEWRITLPYNLIQELPEDGEFEVDISVEVKDGHMLVAELENHGESEFCFTFLAHYCHIAQANDGIAGGAVMLEVMDQIKKRYVNNKYTYRMLFMPEVIGSVAYTSDNKSKIENTIGAVFSEMPGANQGLQFVFSRRANTYIDRVFLQALKEKGKLDCRQVPFRQGWGNDETIFDAPGIGVPSVSIDRHPFVEYHTHHDDLRNVHIDKLDEVVEVILSAIDIIENDYIPKQKEDAPIYLTRYDLYSDWTYERESYDINTLIMDNLWSGLSVLDIALKNDLDYHYVRSYISKMLENELILSSNVTPTYSKNIQFLPEFK
jgi:aminopeptidase-like protein